MPSLSESVRLSAEKLLAPSPLAPTGGTLLSSPILIVLAAGKGTRFGTEPKCIQPVLGLPLARHSIDAFQTACRQTAQRSASETGINTEIQRSEVGGQRSEACPPKAGQGALVRSSGLSPVNRRSEAAAITIVGHKHEQVAAALGPDNLFVLSDNPVGGTAYAVFEAFCAPGLLETNPLVVITMGDRIVPEATFRRLLDTHTAGPREADLTFLTARYEPPRHLGKGRVLRDESGRVTCIVEEKDIAAESTALTRQALHNLTEGNCPLYAIRARALYALLAPLTNDNVQGQFYLTDIVEKLAGAGGEIRTVTTQPSEADYDLLCADVTRPADLALLEGALRRQREGAPPVDEIEAAVQAIVTGRPRVQVASIARQLQEIVDTAAREKLGCQPDQPVAIGISGGRLRIAFMHPDMGRFFGPAWQMPIGAGSAEAGEQIVVLAQATNDRRLHLYPLDAKYRESINNLPADDDVMYPGAEIGDWHSYEHFGTRMSETLLLSLGYFSDEEIEARRQKGQPLPPPTLRVTSNMRRPFALVGNALASFRTLREGHLGARVQQHLDRRHFTGLRLLCAGNIPQGGFSSSSALTVATKNALNSLFDLGVPPDVLVHLACQAEYGTGVRAGSLDQATEQKGRAGEGTLISSNPADNYRILATYPVPADRFKVIFPYSVERDRAAWRWSWGQYAETALDHGPQTTDHGTEVGGQRSEVGGQRSEGGGEGLEGNDRVTQSPSSSHVSRSSPASSPSRACPPKAGSSPLTAGEWRKLTGKAAEIAAILVRLPLDVDFFKRIEADLLDDGRLSRENRLWIASVLRELPLFISRDELQARVAAQREWYIAELQRVHRLAVDAAAAKADSTFSALFDGWREPAFGGRRSEVGGQRKEVGSHGVAELQFSAVSPVSSLPSPGTAESPSRSAPRSPGLRLQAATAGVPLRAMVAYLFSEVAKNFHLIHHPDEWIDCVTRSQMGDRSIALDSSRLPEVAIMEGELPWEAGLAGPQRLAAWLERCGAEYYDFNRDLDAAALVAAEPPEFHRWAGGSFFRGLALIDLAEAMLKRAFGDDAVAVRVNAAGQGDYFQVHIDTTRADPGRVKDFLRRAFYRRFGLAPEPEFVETNPGGGAVGLRLTRYDTVRTLLQRLRTAGESNTSHV